MSRYYFDVLRDGQVSTDLVGTYASNSEAVIQQALDHGKRVAALAEQSDADWRDWMVIVRNHERAVVAAFRLTLLIGAKPTVQ